MATTKRKKNTRNAGRKTVMTKEVLSKLEDAFIGGHVDTEACLLAGIDEATLYRYCNKHPDFARKKELLKQMPTIEARRTLVNAIKKDPDLALKYLERKKKDEFSLKSELDLNTTEPIVITGFNYIVPKDRIDDSDTSSVS